MADKSDSLVPAASLILGSIFGYLGMTDYVHNIFISMVIAALGLILMLPAMLRVFGLIDRKLFHGDER